MVSAAEVVIVGRSRPTYLIDGVVGPRTVRDVVVGPAAVRYKPRATGWPSVVTLSVTHS